jgi:DNA polymerase-3 subunit epsilon
MGYLTYERPSSRLLWAPRFDGLDYTALDFETGDPGHDSACGLGLVLVRGGRIVRRERILIKPPRPPSPIHVALHGLGPRVLARQPTYAERWPMIRMMLRGADFFAAHGSLDESVLRTCCEMIGKAPPRRPFINTVVLARDVWGIFLTRLEEVCRRLEIPLLPHDPVSDAAACAAIVRAAGPENVRRYFLRRRRGHGPRDARGRRDGARR